MSRKRDPRKDRARKRRLQRRKRDRLSRLKWEETQPPNPDECPFGAPWDPWDPWDEVDFEIWADYESS